MITGAVRGLPDRQEATRPKAASQSSERARLTLAG
jgi:hypothetical protein